MEKLVKSILGQWKIVTGATDIPTGSKHKTALIKANSAGQWQVLEKAYVNQKIPQGSCNCGAHKTNSEMHSDWCGGLSGANKDFGASTDHINNLFKQLNDHAAAGNAKEHGKTKGELKDYILKAPKGSVDFGNLNKQREGQTKLPSGPWSDRKVSHDDMAEFINHHMGDAKDLKDIHDNHGGAGAIESVMRVHGSNGSPQAYSPLKFKTPGLHDDFLDLVFPGKNDRKQFVKDPKTGNWVDQPTPGVPQEAPFESTPNDPKLHQDVLDTWDKMYEDDQSPGDDQKKMKDHEEAAIKRGLDRFKRHYKV